MTSPQDAEKPVRAAMDLLKAFREIDPEMTIGAARAFLLIAGEENLSVSDLQRRGGMALSSASRYHHYLGGEDRHHKPGKGLVVAWPSLEGGSRKALRLTHLGQSLVAKVVEAINRAR
jgi:hypothetical protein